MDWCNQVVIMFKKCVYLSFGKLVFGFSLNKRNSGSFGRQNSVCNFGISEPYTSEKL